MVATLSKDSTGSSWSLGNQRSYDVWGGVRTGSATGGPKGRYCANLGHVQDDESGLVYMRARYYEPSTGRFVSEDPAGDGKNYYAFALNDPTTLVDMSGKEAEWPMDATQTSGFIAMIIATAAWIWLNAPMETRQTNMLAKGDVVSALKVMAKIVGPTQFVAYSAALMVLGTVSGGIGSRAAASWLNHGLQIAIFLGEIVGGFETFVGDDWMSKFIGG